MLGETFADCGYCDRSGDPVVLPFLRQTCLSQLDEEFVFNPLSLSCNLYQQLRSRGLLSQPRYPYRSEGGAVLMP